jgi:hypothetical protein
MRCTRIGCGATFVIRQAKEFAKTEIDHTNDIRNLRQLLVEAARQNDPESMESSAKNIRMWVPDDYFAGFCAALAQKKHGRIRFYTDFLKAAHEMTPEERDQVFDIMLSHANFTMHDEDAVHTFIRLNYPPAQQEEKNQRLKQAIDDISEEQNLFAHIPRDVFICHSSSDEKIAMEAYDELTSDGNKCWISYKNLPPDTVDYWSEIRSAIQSCKIILVISSKQCMLRPDPVREMEMTIECHLKRLELKIDDSKHTEFFRFFFEGIQWVRRTGGKEKVYSELRERVCLLLHEKVAEKEEPKAQSKKDDPERNAETKPVSSASGGGEAVSRNKSAPADKGAEVKADAGGKGTIKAESKPDKAGANIAAAEGQKQEKGGAVPPAKKAADNTVSKQNTVSSAAVQPLKADTDKSITAKPKKPKGTSIISKFRRRLGRLLSCILIFAWILLILINYLGLYNVLDDWQYEMPVLKSIYVSGGDIFNEYLEPADFLENTNPVEFLALAGTVAILMISLLFGPLVVYRAASKLAFWLFVLFMYNIYYYLSESDIIKGAILQDKIVLMAGYLMHTIIALAVCMLVRAAFRKAALRQAGK